VGRAGPAVTAAASVPAEPGRESARGRSFVYRAARGDGSLETGRVSADSSEAAAAILVARGLFTLDLRPVSRGSGSSRLSPAAAGEGLRILASLLETGIPLGRALATFEELAPPVWRVTVPTARASLRAGRTFATALDEANLGLTPLVLGIIRAGEASGTLAGAASRAADYMEAQAATRAALRAALAYPALLAGASVASLGLLVGIVLPRFASLLAEMGQAAPPTTRVVLGAANFLHRAALPFLIFAAVSAVVWRAWTVTVSGALRWAEILLSVPLLGRIRASAVASRASTALAALLESGVPMASALAITARTAGDAAIERRLLAARERVVQGSRLSGALQAECAVTPAIVRFVRAGEESGRLATMLERAARIEAERADRLTRGAVRVIEPTLIVTFGGVIALVAAALLQAMYSVRVAP